MAIFNMNNPMISRRCYREMSQNDNDQKIDKKDSTKLEKKSAHDIIHNDEFKKGLGDYIEKCDNTFSIKDLNW